MNMLTPTSDPLPAGLPDEATLARMAAEFFAALPGGGVPVTAVPLPGGAAAPQAALVPQTSPAPQPASLPAEVPVVAGFAVLGVPEAYAAALPAVPETSRAPFVPASLPSTPYYFFGEAAGYPPYYFLAAGDDAPAPATDLRPPVDVNAVRRDFPILGERVNGRPLIWLDNAATTQKPLAVIDRISYFYEHENSNIHRAAHTLAARATDAYEAAREKVRRFLNAGATEEIVFVRGTTEAINLVAQSWGRRNIEPGDEIIVTWLEHHANIVPWQQLAAEKGARLRVAPVDDNGEIILDEYEKLFNSRTKIAAFTQVSNALGTVTPAREMVAIAHRHGALALVDGAQSVSHMHTDVQALGADFFVFSGHKVFGPTGIGVVYGKKAILDATPPWQGGGNMIADVTFEKTLYQPAPAKFEAGTGNIADAVGLGAALDYVTSLGMENIHAYERELIAYATRGLLTVPGLTIIGNAREKAGVISFVLDGFRTEDVGAALDKEGIAVRSGHHCAQPILRRFGVEATVRPSFAPYNTCEDIDALVAAVRRIQAAGPKR